MLDKSRYILDSLDGYVLYGVFNVDHLKPAWIPTSNSGTNNVTELRKKMTNKSPEK